MLCKNCKVELANENGFCQDCGARVIQERISLRFLFQEFLDKVLSYDNKLLKTFIHLFIKPEIVIDGYIKGVRKRYFNPISYLLISITLSGIYLYFFKDMAIESFSKMQEFDPDNPFYSLGIGENLFQIIYDYPAFFTALNIPVYAFVSWIVFFNKKKYNFYEHIVIYLYAISQISILSFLVVLPIYFLNEELASDIFMYSSFSIFIYASYVLIKLFKLNFGQFVLKTLFFSAITFIIIIVISIILVVILFLNISPEQLKQIQNQQKRNQSLKQSTDSLQLEKNKARTKILTPH